MQLVGDGEPEDVGGGGLAWERGNRPGQPGRERGTAAEGEHSRGAVPTGFGGVVDGDGVQQPAGNGLAAFEDGELGGGADEVGEAADHAAGAAVQVAGAAGQRPGLVAVEPQRGFQGGDQALPLGVAGVGAGADQHAAAGDLLAADAGEQPAPKVDAGISEGSGQVLG